MYYLCIREGESEQTRITDEAETIEALVKLAEAEIGDAWTWWIEDEEGNEVYDPNERITL